MDKELTDRIAALFLAVISLDKESQDIYISRERAVLQLCEQINDERIKCKQIGIATAQYVLLIGQLTRIVETMEHDLIIATLLT